MDNCSPMTPGKARRSFCPSEYDTAGEEDSPDNSLYFSIIEEGNVSMNKENTSNGGPWLVTDLSASAGKRTIKGATPLLRKILQNQPNITPRNKHNKRVSFSQSPKPVAVPPMVEKLAKLQLNETEQAIQSETNSVGKKRIHLTPGKALRNRSLVNVSEMIDPKALPSAALTVGNVIQHSMEQKNESTPVDEMNDAPFDSTASTDDIEKDQMHCTIIEYQSNDIDRTLVTTNVPEEAINQAEGTIDQIMVSIPLKSIIAPVTDQAELAKSAVALLGSGRKKKLAESTIVPPNTPNKSEPPKTAEVILSNVAKNSPAPNNTKNAVRLSRARLANDTRKSILPVARQASRQTMVKRRSGTFETRKIDRRGTVARMSMARTAMKPADSTVKSVSNPVKKPTVQKLPLLAGPSTSKATTTKPITTTKTPATTIAAPAKVRMSTMPTKPRMSTVPIKPRMSTVPTKPRLTIYTTRQTISVNTAVQRFQRRQTKYSPATSSESESTPTPSSTVASTSGGTSDSATVKKEIFAKPTPLLSNNKPKTGQSKLPVANLALGFKCKYCDRNFAKNFGLDQHLLEKCEKIPATHRRLLLKNENDQAISNQKNRKQDITHLSQRNNETWKHSRFFVEKINQAVSNAQNDCNATNYVESDLNSLRSELKLLSNAHSGVKRTPKKSLKCHICNQIFWDCVEYAVHSSNHMAQKQQQQS